MQRKSSSYGCTWLLEHLKLNVLLAKFKKTLVSVKYGNTSAFLGCQDEKMQTLEHFWAAKQVPTAYSI